VKTKADGVMLTGCFRVVGLAFMLGAAEEKIKWRGDDVDGDDMDCG